MGIPEESGRHEKQEKQERANIIVRIINAKKSLSIVKMKMVEKSVHVYSPRIPSYTYSQVAAYQQVSALLKPISPYKRLSLFISFDPAGRIRAIATMRLMYLLRTIPLLLTISLINASPLIPAAPQSVSKATSEHHPASLSTKLDAAKQGSIGLNTKPRVTNVDKWDAAVKKGKELLDSLDAAHKKPSDRDTKNKYDQYYSENLPD